MSLVLSGKPDHIGHYVDWPRAKRANYSPMWKLNTVYHFYFAAAILFFQFKGRIAIDFVPDYRYHEKKGNLWKFYDYGGCIYESCRII